MNCIKILKVVTALLAFFSFHVLYSSGWSYDGSWSLLRRTREFLCPSDLSNRPSGWLWPVLGYLAGVIATVIGLALSLIE